MTLACHPPFTLTPLLPLETPRAVPPPRPFWAVLMPFTIADGFYDTIGATLPVDSVMFLNYGADWSARNSESGYVSAALVEKFGGINGPAVQAVLSAGIAERAKRGRVRFVPGKGVTVVNANAVAAQAEREQAKTEKVREQGRIRAKRKRDKDREARLAAMSEGVTRDVTQASRETGAGVTRYAPEEQKKPQVKTKNVTRYAPESSRVTPDTETDRSDLSVSGGQSRSKSTRAREAEPYTPGFRALVAADLALRGPWPVDDATADAVTAEVLGKSKKPVTHPVLFVRRAIASEPDPWTRWLRQRPVPQAGQKKPDHCGDRECSPRTRRRENPLTGADEGPCPKCSGAVPAWVEAAS